MPWITSGSVSLSSGSNGAYLPEWVTGWKAMPPHGGMVYAEPHDVAYLVVVDALLDSRHQHHVQPCLCQPVQSLHLHVNKVSSAHGWCVCWEKPSNWR